MKKGKKTLVTDTWNEEYYHVSYVLPNGNEYYHIEIAQIDAVRKDCNVFGIPLTNVSNLIADLIGKIWIQKRHLYEMIEIIQRRKPNNSINWNHTFYFIEIRLQLDKLHQSMSYNNEFEYHSKIEGMITTDGGQMNRNAAKFANAAQAYIIEHNLALIPESFAG
jgi:hypothetical protein